MIIVMQTINGLAAAIAMVKVFYETIPELGPRYSRLQWLCWPLVMGPNNARLLSGLLTSTAVRPSSAMLGYLAC